MRDTHKRQTQSTGKRLWKRYLLCAREDNWGADCKLSRSYSTTPSVGFVGGKKSWNGAARHRTSRELRANASHLYSSFAITGTRQTPSGVNTAAVSDVAIITTTRRRERRGVRRVLLSPSGTPEQASPPRPVPRPALGPSSGSRPAGTSPTVGKLDAGQT
jgi:hypothetical protein